jgi:hypothetical protein
MKMTALLSNLPQPLQNIIETDENIANFLREGLVLSEILLSEQTLAKLFIQLESWEKRTLELIVQRFATHIFDFNSLQLAARATELSGAELRAGIAKLRRKGILFAMRKSWGENSYFIPSEALRIWQRLLMNSVHAIAEHANTEIISEPMEYRGLAFDLFFTLSYISFHEINLTQKNLLPKRHIYNLADIICLDDALIANYPISAVGANALYPSRVSVILTFATRLNLIDYGPARVTLRHSDVHNWLLMSINKINRCLYSIFKETFCPDLPAITHFITKIEALSFNKWHLVEDIVHWMQEYDIMIVFNEWLGMLTAFGFIESGFNNKGQAAFRWIITVNGTANDISTAAGKLYIQSDYEVLVPPDVSFSVRWELAYIADHLLTEQVGVYRITEKSVLRALSNGRTVEDGIHFLSKCSFFGVPDHIKSAIKHWARSHETVSLLENMRDDVNTDDSSSINPEEALEIYNIESTFLTRSDIYPMWQEIPSMWWKECRHYHGSTRKEIIKQAIYWQTILKLRNESKEWFLIPESLQESEQGWSLTGRIQAKEVVFNSEQWHEMQLILPGFYELDS